MLKKYKQFTGKEMQKAQDISVFKLIPSNKKSTNYNLLGLPLRMNLIARNPYLWEAE